MKMSGLIVAAIVLAALIGTLYWSNHRKPSPAAEASTDVSQKILSLNQADVTQVEIKKKGGEALVLTRSGSGPWQMTEPKPLRVDQEATSAMVGTLAALTSDRLVDAKAQNLQQYGLTDPSLEVDIAEKGNKSHALLIGDNTPTGSDVYAALRGDSRVFTLPSYERTDLDKTVNELRDKRLITLEPDRISRVELSSKKGEIEFGRDKEEWQILKPKPLRADSAKVGDLVREVTGARMDVGALNEDAKKIAAAFNAGTPAGSAKVTDASGTQELQVRKNKDDYYAKSSLVEGVYKVSNDVGQALDKSLDDFRNKNLFDFGYNDPNKIELHAGSKAYFLTRSGNDWWGGDGKKLEYNSALSLIDQIRDLSASKFVDSGYSTPAVELTVTSNDGKRSEKAAISKNGDNYIAKREDDPALYRIDSSRVDDLLKAAEALHPAAAPAKK